MLMRIHYVDIFILSMYLKYYATSCPICPVNYRHSAE